MLLENKSAVVYGAGGAIGSAIARAFAAEGARVFVTGRTRAKVDSLARDIVAAGGNAEAAPVDALDEREVEDHLQSVIATAGRIDISFNAISVPQRGMQGTPLGELSLENFSRPIIAYSQSHFITARAAARRMSEQGGGVTVTAKLDHRAGPPEPGRVPWRHRWRPGGAVL